MKEIKTVPFFYETPCRPSYIARPFPCPRLLQCNKGSKADAPVAPVIENILLLFLLAHRARSRLVQLTRYINYLLTLYILIYLPVAQALLSQQVTQQSALWYVTVSVCYCCVSVVIC